MNKLSLNNKAKEQITSPQKKLSCHECYNLGHTLGAESERAAIANNIGFLVAAYSDIEVVTAVLRQLRDSIDNLSSSGNAE